MGFFIVGAAKAGTTLIWSWLKSHPKIFLPAVKEPHYFCFQNGIPNCGTEMDVHYKSLITTTRTGYQSLYRNIGSGQLAGDASPGYLYYKDSAREIKSFDPEAKIICILRNPIDRAFSQFLHHVRDGLETQMDFGSALDLEETRMEAGWWWAYHYAAAGLYAGQWQNYCRMFRADRRLLLFFDDIERDPQTAYNSICAFLDIAPAYDVQLERRVNDSSHLASVPKFANLHRTISQGSDLTHLAHSLFPSRTLRWLKESIVELNAKHLPVFKTEDRARLRKFYKNDLNSLSDLVDRDLTGWS